MKTLVIGAGVIGSFNAARLKDGGAEVTLLARGLRLADLRVHGVVLEHARTGKQTTTRVPLAEQLGPHDVYDLAIVAVRRNQVASVLPMLAANRRIPSVLFVGNNAAGPGDMVEALGRDRVLLGMGNAGGERQGHVVRYVWWRWAPLWFGELDGATTPRTDAIVRLYRSAGLRARTVTDIDAHLKTHAAGLPALAGAVYRAGGDIRRLAHMPEVVRLFVEAYREALHAVRASGTPLRPAVNGLLERIPPSILTFGWRRFLDSRLAVVGGERHIDAAPDEMKELADELRALFRKTRLPSPASDVLFGEVDERFRTWNPGAEAAKLTMHDTPGVSFPPRM